MTLLAFLEFQSFEGFKVGCAAVGHFETLKLCHFETCSQRVAEDEPEKAALKAKASFSRKRKKRFSDADTARSRISCSLFPGESWHQPAGIYDPSAVAVASQGSSLSHSA
jgi:hypothetical protein